MELDFCTGAVLCSGTPYQDDPPPHPETLTRLDVVPDDADVFVSVRPRVLVPESDHMTQFVHHDAELVAVLPDGNGLRSSAPATHVRATPERNHGYKQYMGVKLGERNDEAGGGGGGTFVIYRTMNHCSSLKQVQRLNH